MKRTTMNLMLAAAALMVASTVASAQTMKAEIPFAFRVGNKVMTPGTYRVWTSNNESQLQIVGLHGGVLVGSGVREDAPKAWQSAGKPILQFACDNDGGCVLRRFWTGNSEGFAHRVTGPKRGGDAKSLAAIRLVSIQAE
jgi:hypothetical protein